MNPLVRTHDIFHTCRAAAAGAEAEWDARLELNLDFSHLRNYLAQEDPSADHSEVAIEVGLGLPKNLRNACIEPTEQKHRTSTAVAPMSLLHSDASTSPAWELQAYDGTVMVS